MTISENIIIEASNRASKAFADLANDAKNATSEIQAGLKGMKDDLQTGGLMLGGTGAGMTALAVSSTMLAARVETLGVVMHTVGSTAGYTAEQMDEFEAGVKKMGITTQASRESLIKLAQANIDLSQATKLARIAQDAAVIGGINSSEAFDRMIHGITTLNPLILRQMGILVNLDQEYKQYAQENNVAVESLDGMTKQQIMTNAVMDAGSKIAGAYESAMGTAGKQLTSLARYTEEARLAMGEAFLPMMSDAIMALTDLLKAFNSLTPAQKAFAGEMVGLGGATLTTAGAIMLFASKIPGTISMLSNLGIGVAQLSMALPNVTAATAPVTNALLGMQSTAAAGAITLGIYAAAIMAVVVAAYKLYEAHKAMQEGVEQTQDAWGNFFADMAASESEASTIAQEYLERQKDVNAAIESGGIVARLFVAGNDQVTGSYEKLSKALYEASDNYQEYQAALQRVAEANGLVIDTEGNLVRMRRTSHGFDKEIVQTNYQMEASSYDLSKGLIELDAAQHGLGTTTENTGQQMTNFYNQLFGLTTPAVDGFANAQASAQTETERMVQEIKNQDFWLKAQAEHMKRVIDLERQAADANREWADAAANWSKTVGGDVVTALKDVHLSAKDYRTALGLVDEALGTNYGRTQDYQDAITQLAKSFDPKHPEEFKKGIQDLRTSFADLSDPLQAAIDKVADINDRLNALNGKRVTAYVNIVETGGTGGGQNPGTGQNYRPPHETYQHGGQFTVGGPGGIDQTRVSFMATAGETVTVTPAGKAAPGGGNLAQVNVTVNAESEAAMGVAWANIRRMRQDTLNASMGG